MCAQLDTQHTDGPSRLQGFLDEIVASNAWPVDDCPADTHADLAHLRVLMNVHHLPQSESLTDEQYGPHLRIAPSFTHSSSHDAFGGP